MTRPTRKGAKNWTTEEWDSLFVLFPPTGRRPSRDQIDAVASRIGRSWDAVDWAWSDAASEIADRPNTASERLKAYLRERGWLLRRG
jgi:hypothetical protein